MPTPETQGPRLAPNRFRDGIDEYVKHGTCGDFLEAVLRNDLVDAVGRADSEALVYLPEIVAYCYWNIPGDCWGSREKVNAWQDVRRSAQQPSDRPPDGDA